MGNIGCPKPAKLFVGLISNDITLIEDVKKMLFKKFGPVDFESSPLNFNLTDYYNKEMGDNLKRKFLSFKKLVGIENIAVIKILTNKLEKKFRREGNRRINIDPGYITSGKLILLTTKDFYHRIYLGKGIYAEVTLYYRDKTFRPFEWSYPDYKTDSYIEFFNAVKDNYSIQLRQEKC